MYNLPTVTADYTAETLSISPSDVLMVDGEKSQVIHEMDDGSVSVISESDTSSFKVRCQWSLISTEDHATILDFWHNTGKANGKARTFKWTHPITEVVYVARFLSELISIHHSYPYPDISTITLLVEGISV